MKNEINSSSSTGVISRKKAIITGGSRGIGRAIALKLADEGYDLAIIYQKETAKAEEVAKLVEDRGATCHIFQGDLSQGETAQELMVNSIKTLGGLDALVCNAGISHFGLLTDLSFADWQHIINTNLSSVFYCCQAVLPHFLSQKSGNIVTISSMWGQIGASCEVAYSTAKAGIIGFTKALAKEVGPSDIRVNCVAPGLIATDMNAHLSQEDLICLKEETPLGRLGTGEEVACSVAFLLSENAKFLTGQVFAPNGGFVM